MSDFDEMKRTFDRMGLKYSEWKTTVLSRESIERKVAGLSLVLFENDREGEEYFFNPDGSFLRSKKF